MLRRFLPLDKPITIITSERAQRMYLDETSAAALMQIFLGLRPTESVIRVVRDLDDEGSILWVPFGKTSNAKRRLQVPEPLRVNLSLRRVADLLGTKSDKRPCVEQLATLLRDNLLPDELCQLWEQLAR